MLAEGPFRSLLAPSDFAGFISPVSLTYSFWPRKIFSQERLQSSQRVRSKGQGNDESPREKTARAEFEPMRSRKTLPRGCRSRYERGFGDDGDRAGNWARRVSSVR
jgi:hypothetical protein